MTVKGGGERSLLLLQSTLVGVEKYLLDTCYSRVRKFGTYSRLRSRTKTLQGSPTPISRAPSRFLDVLMSPVRVPGMNYYYLHNVVTFLGSEIQSFLLKLHP